MPPLRLTIEPIPARSRLASLAKMLPADQWDVVRRAVYRKERYRCQVCGREGLLHCHEVWHYAEETGRQWLAGLQALCSDCHGVKHITIARNPALSARLLGHFAAVNRIPRQEAESHLRAALQRQHQLNQRRWTIDYGSYNASVPCLRDAQHRIAFLRSSGRPAFARPRPKPPAAGDHGQSWRADPGSSLPATSPDGVQRVHSMSEQEGLHTYAVGYARPLNDTARKRATVPEVVATWDP